MTSARRVCAMIDFDVGGRALGGWARGGMAIDYVETVARYLAAEGSDEIWLRLREPDVRGAAGLFDPLRALRDRLFLPLVGWGAVRSASDARLAVGLGADRVVVECSDPRLDDPIAAVRSIAGAVGGDAISAAAVVRRVATHESFNWELCLPDGTGTGHDATTFLVEVCRAGAGELVLIPVFEGELSAHPTDLVERISGSLSVQVVSIGAEKEPADLAAPLLMGADAVATEGLLRDGAVTVADVKAMLLDYGVAVRPAAPPYLAPR